MGTRKILAILVLALGLMMCQAKVSEAGPMGTAFTHQGHLYDANQVANGLYDFQFKLYDANSGGSQIGSDVNKPDVDVIDGYFGLELDFGSDVFDGNAVWLEIGVRPGDLNDPNVYTLLSPRQAITPVPYALQTRGIFVNEAGDVGIGTESPKTRLDVRGGLSVIDTWPQINLADTVSGETISLVYDKSEDELRIENRPGWGSTWENDIVTFEADGNVGIGTRSPTAKLTVNGGILRSGSTMYGSNAHTHMNLGVNSLTGLSGQNYSYATVGGGYGNTASDESATVGGGYWNIASNEAATVGGGYGNIASYGWTTVGGGYINSASYPWATVGGGYGNNASHFGATVGGGSNNNASNYNATVGGGSENTAGGDHATVGGGKGNNASNFCATVGGGHWNSAGGDQATVGGGEHSSAGGDHATVGGGYWNNADGNYAAIGGGKENSAGGYHATVGGGYYNHAGGYASTVSGGFGNIADGDYSFAAGRMAKTTHSGTFVWGDNTYAVFEATGVNQFLIRASGGVGIGTTNPAGYMLAVNGSAAKPGGGSWSVFSDVRLKEISGNYEHGLTEIVKLNPVRYRYKEDNKLGLPADTEFAGVVSQEVQNVIPEAVEENNKGYLMVNNEPIIWAMVNAIKDLKAENETLKQRLEALERTKQQHQFSVAKEVQQ